MDINVFSISMPAAVNELIEADNTRVQDTMYWREDFDWLNLELNVHLTPTSKKTTRTDKREIKPCAGFFEAALVMREEHEVED